MGWIGLIKQTEDLSQTDRHHPNIQAWRPSVCGCGSPVTSKLVALQSALWHVLIYAAVFTCLTGVTAGLACSYVLISTIHDHINIYMQTIRYAQTGSHVYPPVLKQHSRGPCSPARAVHPCCVPLGLSPSGSPETTLESGSFHQVYWLLMSLHPSQQASWKGSPY